MGSQTQDIQILLVQKITRGVFFVKLIEIKYKKEATILNNMFIMNALS